jgi:hypothetical protein
MINEIMNLLSRHTAEPLDKQVAFQKAATMDDIKEKNQAIISLYQKKIDYLTNKLNSLNDLPTPEETVATVTSPKNQLPVPSPNSSGASKGSHTQEPQPQPTPPLPTEQKIRRGSEDIRKALRTGTLSNVYYVCLSMERKWT